MEKAFHQRMICDKKLSANKTWNSIIFLIHYIELHRTEIRIWREIKLSIGMNLFSPFEPGGLWSLDKSVRISSFYKVYKVYKVYAEINSGIHDRLSEIDLEKMKKISSTPAVWKQYNKMTVLHFFDWIPLYTYLFSLTRRETSEVCWNGFRKWKYSQLETQGYKIKLSSG